MVRFPITGDMTTDFVLIVFAVIAGVALALKAEKKWGWLLVLLAFAWAFFMVKSRGWLDR